MDKPLLCEYCRQREAQAKPFELPFNRAGIENISLRVAVCPECLRNGKRLERASRTYGMVMFAGFLMDFTV